jgi:hypothetical protein
VKFFSATLLVEGGGNQLIYGSCSHLLKTSMMRRKKVHTRADSPLLASPGSGRGEWRGRSARHLRERSAEIQLLALRERGRFPGLYKQTTGHAKTY